MSLKWNGNQLIRYVRGASKAAELQAAEVVLEIAQRECPVDTGLLRSSGYVADTIEESGVGIVFNTPYAEYVHDGTKYTPPNPFLERALLLAQDRVREIFAAVADPGGDAAKLPDPGLAANAAAASGGGPSGRGVMGAVAAGAIVAGLVAAAAYGSGESDSSTEDDQP